MTQEIPRRGKVRPISDLPPLPSSALWVEVEGADRHTYRAAPSALGGLTSWNQTSLQMPLDNDTQFDDLKGHPTTPSGSVAIVADVNVPTGYSAEFSGGGGQVQIQTSTDFNFTNGPLVIEGWFRTTVSTQFATIIERSNGSFTQGSWSLLINQSTPNDGIVAWYAEDIGAPVVTSPTGYNDGDRHAFAVVRTGQETILFIDGVNVDQQTLTSFTTMEDNTFDILLGDSVIASREYIGFLDNIRITKGNALYTVNYTPPTPPFPVGS